ncbi:aminoglycoside phosphotransferase family protein [Gordonia bronchialis]|uniref:phosphotransferase n=1 Tax=Gordonia bronchialis TaxID=2054 RepID=UPI001CBDD761|nr:phosphotransferase [Gordonia bronchialis]UAK39415.1 aminoglycoside phosphotransferase family protein [Gordonia bronchialis]
MSVGAKLNLVGQAARVVLHRGREVMHGTRPAHPGEVPISVDDLTPEWLSAALCAHVEGAAVTDLRIGDGSSGTSDRRSLTVGYNRVGTDAGLPRELFTKTTPDIRTRLFTGLTNLFVGESQFYNRLRPELSIESPHGYFAAYDLRSCRSIIIMEDIARTRGAEFGSPQTLRVTRDQAHDMVNLMAAYHAAFWDDPRLDREFGFLQTSSDWQRHLDSMINTQAMVRRGLRRAESVLPESLLRQRDLIWPAFEASLELKSRAPLTLLHHDVHSKNWYVDGDGRMGLYDWQTIVKGTWAIDFAYALNCGLEIADRRAWFDELLGRYLDALAAGGVTPPTRSDAERAYREQSIHGLMFWLATIGAGRMQPDLHAETDCLVNIERLASAVVDAESLSALH